MSENDRKGTLGVFTGERVGVRVTDTGVVDLDADLVGAGRIDGNVLNNEVFSGFPGDGGLADGVSWRPGDKGLARC